MTNIEYETVNAMATSGGSFVQQLAECARRADPDNLQRLKTAFPEIFARYAEVAGTMRASRGATEHQP